MERPAVIAVAALVLGLAGSGIAADGREAATSRTAGGIAYVTGGVGEDERNALHGVRNAYNLRITFAEKTSGAFLAGARVTLADGSGRQIAQFAAEGPWLYAQVAPGTYTIEVEYEGTRAQQKVRVPPGTAREAYFYFPAPTEGTAGGR